jgi:hypothetical protein
MCNCGKRRPAIPDSGPNSRDGTRGLPVARSIPPSTVAPMPPPQPRPRAIQQIRRAMPIAIVAAPVVIPSPRRAIQPVSPIQGVSQGVSPVIWGPTAWFIIHTLTELAFRSDSRLDDQWISFVAAVGASIPCPTCARHFRTWMGWVPFESSVAASTVRARFAHLHNMVNRTNKVPEWSGDLAATYAVGEVSVIIIEVRQRIESMRGIIGDSMLNAANSMLDILGGGGA